jgi:hypothetical protein
VSVVKDVILGGSLPDRTNLGFHLAFGIGCVVGMVVQSRRYQEVLSVAFTAVIVAYIAILFGHLR